MKEIGDYLKETRVNNGVSLDEASEDLNISKDNLENLEDGNVKAFKDIYALKEIVREYSKYLGIDPDKIMDEFNDFMFEHTSKISLEDIEEARKISKEKEEKPKVISPYTYIPKPKPSLKNIKWKKVFLILGIIILIIFIIIVWNNFTKSSREVTNELMGRVGENHEFSN